MLEAIKHIGELERSKTGSELGTLVKDLATKKNYSHVLLLVFEVADGQVTRYTGTYLEEIDTTRKLQYLYSKGSGSNGADVTPTSLVTEPERTLRVKLDAWLKKNAGPSKNDFLMSLATAYNHDHERIVTDVIRAYDERTGKKGYALSLLFEDAGTRKYVGDYPVFRSFVEKQAEAPGVISHQNHVCSVCGEIKPVVYGDVAPGTLKFYTLDKPGYIASGFDERSSWKNFPLCTDCALDLEAGAKYMDEHLNFNLGGAPYYLIPKLVIDDSIVLHNIQKEFRQQEKTLASNDGENGKKATAQEKFEAVRQAERNSERFALTTMGKQAPAVAFDLLFYDKPQPGTLKILQHIQDVAPGRAAAITAAMRGADNLLVFRDALSGVDGGRRNVEFSFWQLAQFFKKPDSIKDQTWKQEYLAVVADIFTGSPVSKHYVLHQLLQKIRHELLDGIYNNQGKTYSFEEWTLRALNTLVFMQYCHIIPTESYEEGKDMSELVVWDQLFGQGHAINTPAKKAIFLTGALSQRLLAVQWQERRSKPFFKELKGLRLKERDVKGLLPKIINKLEEYDKNYYGKLEQEAASYFVQAGDNWDLTIDEINFIFALGMTLSNRLTESKEDSHAATEQN